MVFHTHFKVFKYFSDYTYGKMGETTKDAWPSSRRSLRPGGMTRTLHRLTPLADDRSASFSYLSDYLGRMEEIVYPDGEVLSYGYDAGGQVTGVTGERLGVETKYVEQIGYDEDGQRVYMKYGRDACASSKRSARPARFTAKELDSETALYYFGARYLDPRTSRWISSDPALESYVPVAPVDDEAKKHNKSLPGMGGVFNAVNLNTYHYGGNNPMKYNDPTGMEDEPTTDMNTWEASFMELSASFIAAPVVGGEGVLMGTSLVHFENKDTGESFEATYSFELTSVEGVAAMVGSTVEFGAVTAEFASSATPNQIAESYRGEFEVKNLSLPIGVFGISAGHITSVKWKGFSVGGGIGAGGGYSDQVTDYSLVPGSITPLITPTSSYYIPEVAKDIIRAYGR